MIRRKRSVENGEEALAAALARLRPPGEARAGWEAAFATRVLARAQAELTRRAEIPSLWQLLCRWPAPLVPAAAAALALAIMVAAGGGVVVPGSGGPDAAMRWLENGSGTEAALSGDPLAAVVTDPVLTLIAAESNGEATP